MSDIERILRSTEAALQKIKRTRFSDAGFARLLFKIRQYIDQLIKESAKVARNHKSDSISASYVNDASENLWSGRALRKFKVAGIIGNMLCGIGFKFIFDMVSADHYTTRGIVISSVLLVIGALGIYLQLKN